MSKPRCRCDAYGLRGCPSCQEIIARRRTAEQRRRHPLWDAALDYAKSGWAVFPLDGKQPLTRHGFRDATTDLGQVGSWWTRWPDAGIGAPVPKTMVVVDVDWEAGGFDSLAKLGHVPETLTTITGGGGRHLWFIHPGGELRQGAGILGPGIDTRIPGRGYVVLPPSVHPSGEKYRWADADRGAVMLPDRIAVRLRPRPRRRPKSYRPGNVAGRLAGLAKTVAQAPEGQRNSVLNWAAYQARELPDESQVATVLADAARAAGLEDREIEATLRSGLGVSA